MLKFVPVGLRSALPLLLISGALFWALRSANADDDATVAAFFLLGIASRILRLVTDGDAP